MSNEEMKEILWEDLKVGDTLEDGAVVQNIEKWEERVCYEVKVEDEDPVVVSDDHLMKFAINGGKVNDRLHRSAKLRNHVRENDRAWVCAYELDICVNALGYKAVNPDNGKKLEYIHIVNEGQKQLVRCIGTDRGHYVINGIDNHNTNRLMFYAMSDMKVVKDCGGPYIDALHCKAPGTVCEKCAALSGRDDIKNGDMIGSIVSTNMCSELTQLAMSVKHSLPYFQPVTVIRDDKSISTTWEYVKIGDTFPDNSVCTDITNWEMKQCIKLIAKDGSIITASTDHMIKANAYGKDGERIEYMPMSDANRIELGCDEDWLCAGDISILINNNCKVVREDGIEIATTEAVNDGDLIKVRCITCDSGQYEVNGFINHNTGGTDIKEKSASYNDINGAFEAYQNNSGTIAVQEAPDTMSAREGLFKDLRDKYDSAGIAIDDFNVMMVAKKLTSYKRDKDGLRLVRDNEKCDSVSLGSVGNINNLFKQGELRSSYKYMTTPREQEMKDDAANYIVL